jgi:signal peptidase II
MRFKRNPLFWVAAVISLVLDHLTKFWVVQNFDLTVPPQTQALLPGVFHFTYVVNTGAAFSLFSTGERDRSICFGPRCRFYRFSDHSVPGI